MLYITHYCIARHKLSSFQLSSIDISFFCWLLSWTIPNSSSHYFPSAKEVSLSDWKRVERSLASKRSWVRDQSSWWYAHLKSRPLLLGYCSNYHSIECVVHHSIFFLLYQFLVENPPFHLYISTHMQVRILASLILYQVTMLGFFGVKKFYYGLFPFQDTALEVAAYELKENPDMEQIYKSYIDPTKPELWGGTKMMINLKCQVKCFQNSIVFLMYNV